MQAISMKGVTDAVPETIEASLQLSEATLIGLGSQTGPVIASIREKRDESRRALQSAAGQAGGHATHEFHSKHSGDLSSGVVGHVLVDAQADGYAVLPQIEKARRARPTLAQACAGARERIERSVPSVASGIRQRPSCR